MIEPFQILIELVDSPRAGNERRYSRMGHNKLQCRCRKWYFVIGTDALNIGYLLLYLGRRRRVIIFGPLCRPSRQNARIKTATDHDRNVPFHAEWQEFIQRVLLQERIASGEQEAIKVTGLEGSMADLPLVHTDANRLHHPLVAETF